MRFPLTWSQQQYTTCGYMKYSVGEAEPKNITAYGYPASTGARF